MESNIEVALAIKLQKLFPATKEKFLGFPMGMGFKYEELNFMEDPGNLTAEQLRQRNLYKAQFARLVNVIPQDKVVLSTDTTRFLWDEYRNVLNNANLAESILTKSEEKQYQEAEDFLTDRIDDTVVYSDAVNKYYQYKEIYDEAERNYLDQKITMENSDDNTLKEKWEAYLEKELRDAKDKALTDWINLGYKNKVERYQEIYNRLGQKDPHRYMQSYLNDLNASNEQLDTNDPVGTYTTFYSPSNCFDTKQSWQRITMLRNEINSLIRSAPRELKRFITNEQLNIESISLEYKKVEVLRSWYYDSLFTSRYWKLPDETTIISDGKIPRGGEIPAFIKSMIVTRNIEVTRKKTVDSPSPPLKFSFWAKNIQALKHNVWISKGAQLSPASPNITPILAQSTATPTIVLAGPSLATLGTISSAQPSNYVMAKYVGTSVSTPTLATPIKQEEKKTEEEFVKETLELDGVALIAFVCKRLAKSPNPDKTLKWEVD